MRDVIHLCVGCMRDVINSCDVTISDCKSLTLPACVTINCFYLSRVRRLENSRPLNSCVDRRGRSDRPSYYAKCRDKNARLESRTTITAKMWTLSTLSTTFTAMAITAVPAQSSRGQIYRLQTTITTTATEGDTGQRIARDMLGMIHAGIPVIEDTINKPGALTDARLINTTLPYVKTDLFACLFINPSTPRTRYTISQGKYKLNKR